MVVAQLAEQVWGSGSVVANFYTEPLFTVNCIEKTQKEEKRGRQCPIKNCFPADNSPTHLPACPMYTAVKKAGSSFH